MKVLLSAYACEPYKGSEQEVGWRWALELCDIGHEVTVITRVNNRKNIEKFIIESNGRYKEINFIYYDLPEFVLKCKKSFGLVRIYYYLWQYFSVSYLIRLYGYHYFDIVHHVTFASIRQPSFIWRLGGYFVFGPVAGGDKIPFRLRKGLALKSYLKELVRDVYNVFIRIDPFVRLSFKKANLIYVTSQETKELLPQIYHSKTYIKLAIGCDRAKASKAVDGRETGGGLKFLYVGHFVYLKGVSLLVNAFAMHLVDNPESRLTLIGEGEDRKSLIALAEEHGIYNKINILDWMSRDELETYYEGHDIMIFPSLRDSGGMVVMEALERHLPVIAFDLGGPGVIVDSSIGVKLAVNNSSNEDVITMLADVMNKISRSKSIINDFKNSIDARLEELTWSSNVDSIYKKIENELKR